jgi:hypothetical protein
MSLASKLIFRRTTEFLYALRCDRNGPENATVSTTVILAEVLVLLSFHENITKSFVRILVRHVASCHDRHVTGTQVLH